MQHFADDKNKLIRRLPEDQHDKTGLLNVEFMRVVRGDIRTGRRPYVDCEGARYRNDVLARSPELIKKKLSLVMDPEDARSVTAYLPNGAALGLLTANGFWGIRPHSLEVRKAILSLKRKRLIYLTETQDPIAVYLEYLASMKKGKAAAKAHAKAQRLINKTTADTHLVTPAKANEELPTDADDQETSQSGPTFTY
jgi:hypothetical protein